MVRLLTAGCSYIDLISVDLRAVSRAVCRACSGSDQLNLDLVGSPPPPGSLAVTRFVESAGGA